jgi:hypothetical protein
VIAVALFADASSPIGAWLAAAGARGGAPDAAEVVVFEPAFAAAARVGGAPRVACLPLPPDDVGPIALGADRWHDVVADAYASDARTLAEAISFARGEDRGARLRGPRRLVWLGPLGAAPPLRAPRVGAALPIAPGFTVGRSDGATLCLRQGGHSDQNAVARLHARLEPSPRGATVVDLGSTNGTFARGARVREAELGVGDEVAFAGVLRARLDGAP